MQVSIGIVNWNTREYLRQCLSSVFDNLDGVEAEVIVVDNGSSDGSTDMVRNEFPQVRLIDTGENMGFSKANNLAFQQSMEMGLCSVPAVHSPPRFRNCSMLFI